MQIGVHLKTLETQPPHNVCMCICMGLGVAHPPSGLAAMANVHADSDERLRWHGRGG
jgi:hypothetical protein